MNVNLPHYITGAEIHAGDRVRFRETSGNIVFVSDGDSGEFANGYAEYYGHDAGVMFCSDEGELTFFSEPPEDLELIGRSPAHFCAP
jgi:plastocyanin